MIPPEDTPPHRGESRGPDAGQDAGPSAGSNTGSSAGPNASEGPPAPAAQTEPAQVGRGGEAGPGGPGEQPPQQLDAAQQSLSDALRVSFWLLKAALVVLVLVYLGSGWFNVTEQQRAVRLVFGKIVGNKTYDAGGPYFSWPFPIGDVVRVPTSPRTIDIAHAFWYQVPAGQAGQTTSEMAGKAGPLNPLKDGSLITGDANIVHGQYEVTYHVQEPIAYVREVGGAARARQLVTDAAERGIVHATATTHADAFIRGIANQATAQSRAQAILDQLGCGLVIDTLSADRTAMPLSAFKAYQDVSNAESEKGQLIEKARKQYSSIMRAAAGAGAPGLYDLIQKYEHARAVKNKAQANRAQQRINTALGKLRTPASWPGISEGLRGDQEVGGKVASMISEANTYRTQAVQQVRGEASNFNALLQEYRRDPRIITDRLWQDARQQIFSSKDIEVIYSPTGDLWVNTTGNPKLAQQRETARLKAAQKSAKQKSNNQGGSP